MPHLVRLATSLCDNAVKKAMRPFATAFLLFLGILALPAAPAHGQSTGSEQPIFPKYVVLGVVYAPPGSGSSVTYGQSQMVGASQDISSSFGQSNMVTVSISEEAGPLAVGFGSVGAGFSIGSGWGETTTNSTNLSVQTTQGNAVSTAGPVSSALGVNHDNDIIYILLNPVAGVSNYTGPAAGNLASFLWNGISYNSCDLTDLSDQMNVYQVIGGCDPNQYPFPDIVAIPVWCLKNPYYPGTSCSQWLPYTSRSWDTSYWGTDPDTGLPLGPMLTLRDYANILSQDPFVTQTLVPYANIPNNYCHQTNGKYSYGVNINPNDSELSIPTSPSSANLTVAQCVLAGGIPNPANANPNTPVTCTWPANFCGGTAGSSTVSMQRFDPYDTVQYPEPGINGQPQTYSGSLSYQTTSQNGKTVESTSTTQLGWSVDFTIGVCFFVCSRTSITDQNTYTSKYSTTTETTNQTTSTASYSIVGPQLSDNYQGPTTYNVYKDNVFGTFAFYSNLQRELPPIELSVPLNANVPIQPNGLGVNPPITVAFNTSTSSTPPTFPPSGSPTTWTAPTEPVGTPVTAWIQLTNNSPYAMTMAGPAVTFSDPGFSTVYANDQCSNQVLYAVSSPLGPNVCVMQIQFDPVIFDAPNTGNNPVSANLVAAGTENNINGFQNILVTSTGVTVSGTATTTSAIVSATLLPGNPPAPGATNTYTFPSTSTYVIAQQPTWQFTFNNITTSGMTITRVNVTDSVDFFVKSISCPNSQNATNLNTPGSPTSLVPYPGSLAIPSPGFAVAGGQTCVITLQFTPQSQGALSTGLSVLGTIGLNTNSTVPSQLAGAAVGGTENLPVISANPSSINQTFYYVRQNSTGCASLGAGFISPETITITNNTTSLFTSSVTNAGSASSILLQEGQASGSNACTVNAGAFSVSPNGGSCTIAVNISPYFQPGGCPGTGQDGIESVNTTLGPNNLLSVNLTFAVGQDCLIPGCPFVNGYNGSNSDIVVSRPNPIPIVVGAGSSGSTSLLVSAGKSFSGNVSFACQNLPANASCSFNPSTVTLAANGSQTTNLTVSVAASNATAHRGNRPALPLSALAALLCFVGLNRRTRSKFLLLALVSLAGFAALSACGGSGGGSPQHLQTTTTSTIIVVATSGNVNTALDVPITVTQ